MHPGFKLDVRPVIGVHRESNVIFFESDTVLDNDRTRTREDLANVVIVRDSAGVMSIATDSASVNTWNRREEYVDEANLVDKPRRDQVAQIMLAQRKAEKSQWTISVDPNSPSRRVFRDFDLGDWVGIHRFNPDLTATIDAYRVMAITVQVDQNGKETLELTLETKLDALVRKLQRQLTAIKFTNNNVKVTLPDGGAAPQPLVWDPGTKSWVPGSWPSTPPGGVQVFIQSTDPGSAAHTGDFWYQT
jgi:hypothetical protein